MRQDPAGFWVGTSQITPSGGGWWSPRWPGVLFSLRDPSLKLTFKAPEN